MRKGAQSVLQYDLKENILPSYFVCDLQVKIEQFVERTYSTYTAIRSNCSILSDMSIVWV